MEESKKAIAEKDADEEQKSLETVSEVLSILIMTHESKNAKLTLQALDILRKIMNFKYLSKVRCVGPRYTTSRFSTSS
jgi:hypothetical protein